MGSVQGQTVQGQGAASVTWQGRMSHEQGGSVHEGEETPGGKIKMGFEQEILLNDGIQTDNRGIIQAVQEPSISSHSLRSSSCPNISWQELFSCGVASIGSFSMGLALGYSSPVNAELLKRSVFTEDQCSWFSALLPVGAAFGGPVAGVLVEKTGRKTTVMLHSLPYVFGWLLIIAMENPYVMYAGRILIGLGVGMTTLCVPLYIAEIAPKEKRGALSSGIQIGCTTGILSVYMWGMWLNWKWLAVSCAFFPCLFLLTMLLVPESPRWLLMKRRRKCGLEALMWLRKGKSLEATRSEYAEMEISIKEQNLSVHQPWSDLVMVRSLRGPLILSLTLMILQQFCGVNAVIFYTHSILTNSGYRGEAGIPSVVISAIKVGITVIMISVIDRAGRRVLFIFGGLGMGISCVALGVYHYLIMSTSITPSQLSWISLASLTLYVISFSLGWSAIPWIIMSEVFPSRARGRASSLATALNWSCAFVVTKTFLPLQHLILPYGVFWAFAAVCFSGAGYTLCCMMETKGKSLEEIEHDFQSGKGSCC